VNAAAILEASCRRVLIGPVPTNKGSAGGSRGPIEKMAVEAERVGWKRAQARGGGFHRPPDAFSALPKAGTAAAPKPKK